MSNEKRIFVLHKEINDIDSFKDYIIAKDYLDGINLVWDADSPDYLFATEQIYSEASMWELFKKLYPKCKLAVFYTIEALSVDFNLFDFGFTYDDSILGERHCRVLPPEDYYQNWLSKKNNDINSIEDARLLLPNKQFCNFLYSNWNAHPYRDQLFFAISNYKHVDSLGRHLNNIGQKGTGYIGHASEVVGIKSRYKFTIACENAFFPGYTTEKMLSSLEAHTVPIYFGNMDISLEVNPDCYINCLDYDNISDVVKKVKEIDENDDLWCSMISRPWYTKDQLSSKQERRARYYSYIQSLFTEEIKDLELRGKGTALYKYNDFMFNHKVEGRNKKILKMIINKVLNNKMSNNK